MIEGSNLGAPGFNRVLYLLELITPVETAGLEPAAFCLQGRCSSYDELGPPWNGRRGSNPRRLLGGQMLSH